MDTRAVSADLQRRAEIFRALSHPARLSLLRLIWQDARSGEELAGLLNLAPATVSHHLSLLGAAGLCRAQAAGKQRLFSACPAALEVTLATLVRGELPPQNADPYRERVLATFFKRGRLVRLPSQRKKRLVVLAELAGLFEPGQPYPEAQVNAALAEYHDDFCTLRRELVDAGLLSRAGGIYQRTPDAPTDAAGAGSIE